MKVRSFMIPKAKVCSCNPDDTLALATFQMMENNIGSVIVMPIDKSEDYPVGIVTKTDLLRGWQQGLDLHTATVNEIMGTTIETILDSASKDTAAEHFANTKHRHAFVVDQDKRYVGIVGALDIAVECAKDSKAWPFMNRDELAEKFKVNKAPKPKPASKAAPLPPKTLDEKYKVPQSPTQVTKLHPVVAQQAPKSPPQSPHRTFLDIAGTDE